MKGRSRDGSSSFGTRWWMTVRLWQIQTISISAMQTKQTGPAMTAASSTGPRPGDCFSEKGPQMKQTSTRTKTLQVVPTFSKPSIFSQVFTAITQSQNLVTQGSRPEQAPHSVLSLPILPSLPAPSPLDLQLCQFPLTLPVHPLPIF